MTEDEQRIEFVYEPRFDEVLTDEALASMVGQDTVLNIRDEKHDAKVVGARRDALGVHVTLEVPDGTVTLPVVGAGFSAHYSVAPKPPRGRAGRRKR